MPVARRGEPSRSSSCPLPSASTYLAGGEPRSTLQPQPSHLPPSHPLICRPLTLSLTLSPAALSPSHLPPSHPLICRPLTLSSAALSPSHLPPAALAQHHPPSQFAHAQPIRYHSQLNPTLILALTPAEPIDALSYYYNYKYKELRGMDAIPQLEYWKEVPGLVRLRLRARARVRLSSTMATGQG